MKGILAAISVAEGGLYKVEAPCKAGLLARLGTCNAGAEAVLLFLDKQAPSFEDTVRINDALQTFGGDARLQGSLNLAKHIADDAASGGAVWKRKYLLTQTPSMESVYPELVCAEDACKGIRLEVATNETRSLQIQVVAPWEPLSQVKVEAGALKTASGVELSATQVQVRQLGYLHSPNTQFSSGGTGSDRRWFPDPLVGNAPLDVKPGLAKTLWVSVDVPAGTPPGDYAGVLRVAPAGKPATEVPIRVKVWNFTLPEVPTLRVWSWFCPHFGRLNLMDLKNYEDFFKEFSRYKVGLDPNLSAYLGKPIKQIKVFKNSDGSYKFDFSGMDPYYEIAFRHGARCFSMALGCNNGLREWLALNPRVTLPDGKFTGPRLFPEGAVNTNNRQAPFEEPMRPLYEQMLKDITVHWKEKGWFQYAHFEARDEPGGSDDLYVKMYRNLKAMVPDLPLMSFGVGPACFVHNIGINSAWAPLLRSLPNEIEAMRQRKTRNETLFTYICSGIACSQNRNSPDVFVWEPPVERQILGWMSWKWGLDGFFVFMSNGKWRSTNDAKLLNTCGDWNPWPYDTIMGSTESPEIGKFIYQLERSPGQWTWIPSVRLDNWRDGIEDYEYLHMVDTMRERLARFTGVVSEVDRRRLLDQAQALLNLEELIPGEDVFAWNHNYKPYQTRRHALGEWLDAVSNILGSGNK